MMKLSKVLMLSVSGLIFTSNGSAASIHNLISFNAPGAVTFGVYLLIMILKCGEIHIMN